VIFGVCGNELSADGHIVDFEYGCGAHSDTPAPAGSGSPMYDPFDDGVLEISEKPAEAPVEEPTEEPAAEVPTEEPAAEVPVEEPVDESGEEPAEPVDEPAEVATDEPVEPS
jgi:outer membrane biosynthesis protein TonB